MASTNGWPFVFVSRETSLRQWVRILSLLLELQSTTDWCLSSPIPRNMCKDSRSTNWSFLHHRKVNENNSFDLWRAFVTALTTMPLPKATGFQNNFQINYLIQSSQKILNDDFIVDWIDVQKFNMVSSDSEVPLFTEKQNAVVQFESTWNSDR